MEKLVDLIKSMTKSEKRYFKLMGGMQKGEKNYLELMDAIAQQKEYDEKKLLKKFEGRSFIKNFGIAKSDLYKLLMKSLRQYHSQSSLFSQLSDMIKDVEILYRKGLYEQCSAVIKRGLLLAEKSEQFLFKNWFLSWQRVLNQSHYYNLDETSIHQSWKEANEALKLEANQNDYWKVSSLCFLYYRKYSVSGDRKASTLLKKMQKEELMQNENRALTFLARQRFYNTQVFFSQVNGDVEASLLYSERNVKLFESNPSILKEYLKSYIILFHNYISILIDAGDYEKAKKEIDRFTEIPKSYPKQKQKTVNILIFRYEAYLELSIANQTCQFDRVLSKIERFYEHLESFKEDIGVFAIMKIYYQLSYMYFLMEDYNTSQNCSYRILQRQGLDWNKESFHINLIYLLSHYELGNVDLQESIGRQLYRLLRTGDHFSSFENILSNFVRKLPLIYQQKELQKLYQTTFEALEALPKEDLNPITLDNFNIMIWLKSKIKGERFADLVLRG